MLARRGGARAAQRREQRGGGRGARGRRVEQCHHQCEVGIALALLAERRPRGVGRTEVLAQFVERSGMHGGCEGVEDAGVARPGGGPRAVRSQTEQYLTILCHLFTQLASSI